MAYYEKGAQIKEGTHKAGCGRIPDAKLPLSSKRITPSLSVYNNTHGVLPAREAHISFVSRDFIEVTLHRLD